MGLKRRLPRVKAEYGVHQCKNCDTRYDGNFCPKCGQTAKTLRLTWKGWWQNFLEVWGIGNTPFIRSISGLLYRPGYLIADYLEGRRIRYFSPSKALFIVTAAMALLRFLFPGLHKKNIDTRTDGSEMQLWMGKVIDYLDKFNDEHMLFMLALGHACLLFPLKFYFRKSPLRPGLTTPEHVFIQVFLITQFLLVSIIWVLLTWGHVEQEQVYVCPSWIYLIILILDMKQLFGLNWWSTIWRSVMASALSLVLVLLVIIVFFSSLAVLHYKGII